MGWRERLELLQNLSSSDQTETDEKFDLKYRVGFVVLFAVGSIVAVAWWVALLALAGWLIELAVKSLL